MQDSDYRQITASDFSFPDCTRALAAAMSGYMARSWSQKATDWRSAALADSSAGEDLSGARRSRPWAAARSSMADDAGGIVRHLLEAPRGEGGHAHMVLLIG